MQRQLREIGFREVVDRWTVRSLSNERSGWRQGVVNLGSTNRAARLVGDFVLEGMEYIAIK